MRHTAKFVRRSLRLFWRGLREWCGDAAYERYLCAKSKEDTKQRVLTAEEFYVEQINRRYSRPNRCC
ncbi:MAG: CstA-like transporter-associated (seleno)protein [Candidatus Acidiferrum sp.]